MTALFILCFACGMLVGSMLALLWAIKPSVYYKVTAWRHFDGDLGWDCSWTINDPNKAKKLIQRLKSNPRYKSITLQAVSLSFKNVEITDQI